METALSERIMIDVPAISARSHMSGRMAALLALFSANLIWGTTFVATKPMLERIPPLTIATGRFAIALLVLLPFLLKDGRRPNLSRNAALLGFSGTFLACFSQNLGLEFTSATNAALIFGGVPVLTILIAGVVLAERMDRSRLTGLLISLIGVGAVVLCGTGARVGLSLLGDSLIVLSALSLAIYMVVGRKAFAGDGTFELVTGSIVYGLIFLIPASVLEIGMRGIERPTNGDLACWIYLGVAASALGLLFEGFALRHLEAGHVALFTNLSPLVGIVVAAWLLGESLSLYQLGGGALILAGVWISTRNASPADVPEMQLSPEREPSTIPERSLIQ